MPNVDEDSQHWDISRHPNDWRVRSPSPAHPVSICTPIARPRLSLTVRRSCFFTSVDLLIPSCTIFAPNGVQLFERLAGADM